MTVRVRAVGVRRLRLLAWAFPLLAWLSPRGVLRVASRVAATCGVDIYRRGRWEPAGRIRVRRG